MPKSLGQIHVANFEDTIASGTAPGRHTNIDLPGQLTAQLQNMVRAGNYFKVTGIDMALATDGTVGGGQLTGHIRYFSPTRGRCNAFKGAFKAMADVMDLQGIKMRDNKLYDFRAPLNDHTDLANVFDNQATLDGTNGLCLWDENATTPGRSIFDVHNRSQQPQYEGTPGDLFGPGFDTILSQVTAPAQVDFVLNDAAIWSGDENVASTDYQKIPFELTWTPDSTDLVANFQWRPDPALYVAVLCGQMQIFIEEINLDSEAPGLDLSIAVHVAGWKSIMGNPDKKRRSSMKKSRGRRR